MVRFLASRQKQILGTSMYDQLSVCHSRSFRNMACLSRMRCLARYTSISVLLILILCLNICYALYEDQVGLFDWRQKFIGKVKFAYFNQYSHSSRRALVATESNVIAALNARTGSIIWRKVFENKHGNVDALLHHANTFISVSGSGKMLRSWEQSKGIKQFFRCVGLCYQVQLGPNIHTMLKYAMMIVVYLRPISTSFGSRL